MSVSFSYQTFADPTHVGRPNSDDLAIQSGSIAASNIEQAFSILSADPDLQRPCYANIVGPVTSGGDWL